MRVRGNIYTACRAHGVVCCATCLEYALGLVDEMDRHADDEEDYWRRTGHRPGTSEPFVLGGQGREPEDLADDASGIVALTLWTLGAAFVGGIVVGVLGTWMVRS